MGYANAVFDGGGVKCIALVGAAEIFEEKGYTWHSIAGSSGGSIVAALLAAGYTSREIHRLLEETQLRDFIKGDTFMSKVPFIGAGIRLFTRNGLYTGDPLEEYIREKLLEKGIRTYQDLKRELKVTVSDITMGRLVVIPDDLPHYGIDPNTFDVALSVRMSASLPFFFEPVFITYGELRQFTSCMVDGGILSNFPVWIFDDDEKMNWPTFGFRLHSPMESMPNKTKNNFDILKAIIATLLEAHDSRAIDLHNDVRTVVIPTLGVKTTEFSLPPDQFQVLYQSGRRAAENFFIKWSYEEYIKLYRKKK